MSNESNEQKVGSGETAFESLVGLLILVAVLGGLGILALTLVDKFKDARSGDDERPKVEIRFPRGDWSFEGVAPRGEGHSIADPRGR